MGRVAHLLFLVVAVGSAGCSPENTTDPCKGGEADCNLYERVLLRDHSSGGTAPTISGSACDAITPTSDASCAEPACHAYRIEVAASGTCTVTASGGAPPVTFSAVFDSAACCPRYLASQSIVDVGD